MFNPTLVFAALLAATATASPLCPISRPGSHGFKANFFGYPIKDMLGWRPQFFDSEYTTGGVQYTAQSVTAANFRTSATFGHKTMGTIYGHRLTVSNYTVELTGWFTPDQTGEYDFTIKTDNGASMTIAKGLTCCNTPNGDKLGGYELSVRDRIGGGGNIDIVRTSKKLRLEANVHYFVKIVTFNWAGNGGLDISYVAPNYRHVSDMGQSIYQHEFDTSPCPSSTLSSSSSYSSSSSDATLTTTTTLTRYTSAIPSEYSTEYSSEFSTDCSSKASLMSLIPESSIYSNSTSLSMRTTTVCNTETVTITSCDTSGSCHDAEVTTITHETVVTETVCDETMEGEAQGPTLTGNAPFPTRTSAAQTTKEESKSTATNNGKPIQSLEDLDLESAEIDSTVTVKSTIADQNRPQATAPGTAEGPASSESAPAVSTYVNGSEGVSAPGFYGLLSALSALAALALF